MPDSLWGNKELKDTAGLIHPDESWPCMYSLLSLRHLGSGQASDGAIEKEKSALMFVHRTDLDCNYPETHIKCSMHVSREFN